MSYMKKINNALDEIVLAGVESFIEYFNEHGSVNAEDALATAFQAFAKDFHCSSLKKEKVPRAPTSYQLFSKEKRPEVVAALKAEMGESFTQKAVMIRIGQLWKEQAAEWTAANGGLIAAAKAAATPSASATEAVEAEPEPVPAPAPKPAKGRKAPKA